MRLGVLLPTFRRSPEAALAVGAEADGVIDGVFAYDHLWPMGSPERPALAPFEVLAAVAARATSLVVGPLVARVGLAGNEVLAAQLRALRLAADGRVVAALGTGDRLSVGENLAYGVAVAPAADRRAALRALAGELVAEGVEVWVGDGASETRRIAAEVGCTLNLWQRSADEVAQAAAHTPVSWAGVVPKDGADVDEAALATLLGDLERAGATWAVFAPGVAPGVLARCRPPATS